QGKKIAQRAGSSCCARAQGAPAAWLDLAAPFIHYLRREVPAVGVVELVPYDASWVMAYDADCAVVCEALGAELGCIDHIGSTSIPGMCAKPIIDIAAVVPDFSLLSEAVNGRLARIGYEYVPHSEFLQRRFYRRGPWGAGSHHLHIYELGSEGWKQVIVFRDYLRAHPEAAGEYARLKLQLAQQCETRAAYTSAKGPFVETILQRAATWRRPG
ncbi:MAG: GrpB family protein, partial [Firmicutes bacterium]|nr:GrpB family protein [Bacillota bacterium]